MSDVEGLMALADAGDVNAAYLVGLHFYCADPGEDDPVASARWFQLAVEGGHKDAKFYLAQQYEHGEGVPVDVARAIQLYEQAAAAGSGDAYGSLGLLHGEGLGVEKNEAKEIECYRRGVELGSGAAQLSLGIAYWAGQGVAQDYDLAAEHIRSAAEKKWPPADFWMGTIHWYGQGVEKNEVVAFSWMKRAADGGSADAAEELEDWRHEIASRGRAASPAEEENGATDAIAPPSRASSVPQAWRSWDLALVCCGTALLAAALWRVPFQVEWHWSLGILTAIVFLVAIIVWVWAEKSPEPPDGRYEAYRKRLPSLARFYSKLLMQLPGKLGFVIAPVALFDPGGAVPLNQRLALATLAGVLAALWARWVERSFPLWRASMNSFVGYFGIVALLPRLGLWNVLVFLVGLRVTMLFAVKYFEREA